MQKNSFILAANVNQSKHNPYIVYITYNVYKASLITKKDTFTETIIKLAKIHNILALPYNIKTFDTHNLYKLRDRNDYLFCR